MSTKADMVNVLECKNLWKSFPGVTALKGVDFEVAAGELLGVVGENGAGKSTLMKILVGMETPEQGSLVFQGRTIAPGNPRHAAELGIGMVFQEGSLLPNLSVVDNLFLSHEDQFSRFGMVSGARKLRQAESVLKVFDLDVDPRDLIGELSSGSRQMVEIARLLWLSELYGVENPVLILDEPTTVLQDSEVKQLFSVLRRTRDRASVVFISHRLEEIVELSDRTIVLRDGERAGTLSREEATAERIEPLMVGHTVTGGERFQESMRAEPAEETALEVKGLWKKGLFEPVNFTARHGEILSLVGLLGSGKEAICQCLAGIQRADGGSIRVFGKDRDIYSPDQALRAGIGYIPIDRRAEGLATNMTVMENINLIALSELVRGGLLSPALQEQHASEWVREAGVRTPSIRTPCTNLSGGNQQKVVLAKWLSTDVRILILDHPTRGIDVNAKREIYARMRKLAASGMTLLLMSDTLDEDIGMSHRMLILREGQLKSTMDNLPGRKPEPIEIIKQIV